MAAHTILYSTTFQSLLHSPRSNPNQPHLFSSFPRQPLTGLTLSSAARRPLTVVAAAKKAVAVLKETSTVEALSPSLKMTTHEYGDTTNGCISTGANFNPNKMTHGAPEDEIRHVGDLGNIVANADGVAEATIVDKQIPLSGPNSVVGKAFVVHELKDDLGKGGTNLDLPLAILVDDWRVVWLVRLL